MKKQIILLAISILGVFSLHAQEINKSLTQSKKEVNSQPRKGTDWNLLRCRYRAYCLHRRG